MRAELALDILDQLIGRQIGVLDVPCPLCGPDRRHPLNRCRKVMRIWRHDPGFASYHCVRCGASDYARQDCAASRPFDPIILMRARADARERERQYTIKQHRKALWLWRRRRLITGSIAETYLREVRRYHGRFPATLGFVRARGEHPPAMIAAFGLAEEIEPGVVAINDVALRGIHITKLKLDGSGKADTERNKIIIGRCVGSPIVLAPVNDLLGLAICEGIEDTLSTYEATGLGAWAAGAASRLPGLAEVIPEYVESLSILVDDDNAGRRHSTELARRAAACGIQVRQVDISGIWRNPA
jgi:Toprim domain